MKARNDPSEVSLSGAPSRTPAPNGWRLWWRCWRVRWSNWEFWPIYVVNLPMVFFWLWFALRARRWLFFTAVNPAIETGGLFGESKKDILERLPPEHLPRTVFLPAGSTPEAARKALEAAGLGFPLIVKPNVGERGLLVEKISSPEALQRYFRRRTPDLLLQEFVDYPMELAVLHYRLPGCETGVLSSLCIKEPLRVRGDGRRCVEELMAAEPRALLQLERFRREKPALLRRIPAEGEEVLLEPIGNHCRGTAFLDGSRLIDAELKAVFDRLSARLEGIHYGRYDLKCRSIEDLRQGRHFKILEYNGIGAEPAHIYDPRIPLLEKYRIVYRHWRAIFEIYRSQRARGVEPLSLGAGLRALRSYFAYLNSLNA